MKEKWKTISGFEDYEISSNGRIRNIETSRILKPWKNYKGYENIELRNNLRRVKFLVHRLVASEFIPNSVGSPEVHHINHIRDDNRVENLQWVTAKMNVVAMWINHLEKLGYKIIKPEELLPA